MGLPSLARDVTPTVTFSRSLLAGAQSQACAALCRSRPAIDHHDAAAEEVVVNGDFVHPVHLDRLPSLTRLSANPTKQVYTAQQLRPLTIQSL
jgi:hypothetical protein